MPNLASVTIHGVNITADVEKLNPESLKNMAVTAITRRLSLGAKTKTVEDLTKLAAEIAADPNIFFTSTRGTGVSRPKLDMYEKKARSYFNDDFVIHLKNGVPQVVAVWEQLGGAKELLFKANDKMTPEQIATVNKNLAAKAEVIKRRVPIERKKAEKAGAKVDLDLG